MWEWLSGSQARAAILIELENVIQYMCVVDPDDKLTQQALKLQDRKHHIQYITIHVEGLLTSDTCRHIASGSDVYMQAILKCCWCLCCGVGVCMFQGCGSAASRTQHMSAQGASHTFMSWVLLLQCSLWQECILTHAGTYWSLSMQTYMYMYVYTVVHFSTL